LLWIWLRCCKKLTSPKPTPIAFDHFIFKQFLISTIKVSTQEAKLAKEKMHGKLACGRPLVVRLASEKYMVETAEKSCKGAGESNKTSLSGSSSGQMNRSAKIAAIKNKLKALGEESSSSAKKQKQAESISCTERLDNCTN